MFDFLSHLASKRERQRERQKKKRNSPSDMSHLDEVSVVVIRTFILMPFRWHVAFVSAVLVFWNNSSALFCFEPGCQSQTQRIGENMDACLVGAK